MSKDDQEHAELLECKFKIHLVDPYFRFFNLPYTFVCDGVVDCEDGQDERMCLQVSNDVCEGGKSCPASHWMSKREDICLKTNEICDGVQDCLDNSDEELCDECIETLTEDGTCLPTRWFETKSDFHKFKRLPQIASPVVVYTSCNNKECLFENDKSKPVTICDQIDSKTFNSAQHVNQKMAAKCHYLVGRSGTILGCSDGSHLKNCEHVSCGPGFFKCFNSYCIPNSMKKNGREDCPSADDEEEFVAEIFYCRQEFTRKYSESKICDGRCDCITGCDDELLCHKKCPSGFMCLWGVTKVIHKDKVNYTNLFDTIDESTKLLRVSGLDLSQIYVPQYIMVEQILEIHLSNCSLMNHKLTEILFAMSNSLHNVYHLDLSYNKITLENFDEFYLLFLSLTTLNLSHTLVSKLHIQMSVTRFIKTIDMSLSPLQSLKFFNKKSFSMLYLNVSSTPINTVGWFDKDISVGTVDLRNTNIIYDLKTSEHLQHITIGSDIYGDSYKLCCEKFKGPGIPSHTCNAPSDAISSCENLLDDVVKRTLIWLVALIGSSGNAIVVGYRIFYEKHLLKQGYRMFVTNLGLSDLIMSVYLLIIAGADVYYRDDYVLYDTEWRDSSLCKAAGFLATLSTETSSLFVLLITLDRYFTFKNPLNQTKFTPQILACVVTLIWATGLAISTIPILFPDWQVYSSNAVCLALPVNLTHPLGWMFSLLLYTVVNFLMMIMIISGQMLIFKQIAMPSNSLINTSAHRRREITVAKNLSLVVVSNVLCWFPICIISLMSAAGYIFSPDVYGWLAVAIMPLNSAVNPILYTLPVAYQAFNEVINRRRKN
ncbi:G-protein coupled receptor GRL101-like [Physella acuta]|uniref:G-protein coupled receptor GRL101-like n=1 Tax=Physella acuta TaxID=109671 RepID=UPI0027DB85CC|nr:G-protein coupled receptor GRL101-like [Physella acuta]